MSHTPSSPSDVRRVFVTMADEHGSALAMARQCVRELRERRAADHARLLARALRPLAALRVSASYAGYGEMLEVCAECEEVLSVAEHTSSALSAAQLDALDAALEFLSSEVLARQHGTAHGSAAQARVLVHALRDASAGGTAIDLESEDYLLFAEDGIRLVNECRRAVLKAAESDGGEQRAWIDSAFRAAHTLKGNAGLMGLAALESVGRAAEHALEGLRTGDVVFTAALTIALVALLERAFEGLRSPLSFSWLDEAKQLEHATADARSVARRTRLGELLLERNLVSPEQIELVLAIRRAPLGEALVRMQALSQQDLTHTLDLQRRIRQGERVGLHSMRPSERASVELVERSRIARVQELAAAVLGSLSSGDAPQLAGSAEALWAQLQTIDHVSIEPIARKARQACTDTARRLDKSVELTVDGSDAFAPRAVVEMLSDAVLHLVRNAVDHGIEARPVRAATSKPAVATVSLCFRSDAHGVCVEVRDDGAGLDRNRIVARARSQGLVDAATAATMTDDEVYDLVFAPGFSTAEVVTDVSGRGVGMDVVRTGVLRLGGTVRITSLPGTGTSVVLDIPHARTSLAGGSIVPGAFGLNQKKENK